MPLDALPALLAAMDIALKAASGYSVRTCPSRDIISSHWGEFNKLHKRIRELESQREQHHMARSIRGKKYIHVGIDEHTYDRFMAYLAKNGGGKVRAGSMGDLLSDLINNYLNRLEELRSAFPGNPMSRDKAA